MIYGIPIQGQKGDIFSLFFCVTRNLATLLLGASFMGNQSRLGQKMVQVSIATIVGLLLDDAKKG